MRSLAAYAAHDDRSRGRRYAEPAPAEVDLTGTPADLPDFEEEADDGHDSHEGWPEEPPETVAVHSEAQSETGASFAEPVAAAPAPATSAPALAPLVIPKPTAPPLDIKPLSESRRFWGEGLRRFGHIVQVIGITGPFGLGPAATQFGRAYGAVIADPVTFDLALSITVVAIGWFAMHAGGLLRKIGEHGATHALGTEREVAIARAAR